MKDLKNWDGQSPPTPVHQKGKAVYPIKSDDNKVAILTVLIQIFRKIFSPYQTFHCFFFQFLPNFGEFLDIKKKKIAELKEQNCSINEVRHIKREIELVNVPKVKDVVGISLKYISSFKSLDTKKQVIALINDVSLIKIRVSLLIYN